MVGASAGGAAWTAPAAGAGDVAWMASAPGGVGCGAPAAGEGSFADDMSKALECNG
jgi:hypothetical protein